MIAILAGSPKTRKKNEKITLNKMLIGVSMDTRTQDMRPFDVFVFVLF